MEPVLYKRMKMVCKALNITHKMLAEESGISIYTVQAQMQGKRGVDVELVMALARLVPNINMGWLLIGRRTDGNYTPEPDTEAELVRDLTCRIAMLEEKLRILEATK